MLQAFRTQAHVRRHCAALHKDKEIKMVLVDAEKKSD
jgi:hypothetical protein